ncbi:MAG TPA: hypothetical protein VFC80_04095 [Sphaerochaeta sp.]|nr:hypothetical protein [Sphaerochaeta sp.]
MHGKNHLYFFVATPLAYLGDSEQMADSEHTADAIEHPVVTEEQAQRPTP